MNVVLIGFKACGKSTVGEALARLGGRRFVDTDQLLEARFLATEGEALSCRDILTRHGAQTLRRLESEVLASLGELRDSVIATGGGAVLAPANRALLRAAGTCVFLDTPRAELEQRLRDVDTPLFATQSLADVHTQRLPLYLETAHIRLEPEAGEAPAQIAARIAHCILAATQENVHGQ